MRIVIKIYKIFFKYKINLNYVYKEFYLELLSFIHSFLNFFYLKTLLKFYLRILS